MNIDNKVSLKVYLAAPFSEKEKMEEVAKKIEELGHSITHRWWDVEEEATEDKATYAKEMANADCLGVTTAHLIFLINSKKSEGKAVEQGLAIAMGKPIIAVGKRGEFSKNVFHYLDNYAWVADIESGLIVLGMITLDPEVKNG